jgi:hypothetical protein
MLTLRLLLATIFTAIAAYTVVTIGRHGRSLLPVFFGDMSAMTWPGQFNTDFFSFLLLGGLWLAWRHRFSPVGLALGAAGVFGGMLFLSAYLFIASFRAHGDVKALLLGEARA